MAFTDNYRGPENPGKWHDYVRDDEREVNVRLRVRRLDDHTRNALLKIHGKRKKLKGGGFDWVVPRQKMSEYGLALAVAMWTDIENGFVRCSDEESVKFYADELHMKVELGMEVQLDGKLTDAIKSDLAGGDFGLKQKIQDLGLGTPDDDFDEEEDYEEAMSGNSRGSSTSDSATPSSPRNAVEGV